MGTDHTLENTVPLTGLPGTIGSSLMMWDVGQRSNQYTNSTPRGRNLSQVDFNRSIGMCGHAEQMCEQDKNFGHIQGSVNLVDRAALRG